MEKFVLSVSSNWDMFWERQGDGSVTRRAILWKNNNPLFVCESKIIDLTDLQD